MLTKFLNVGLENEPYRVKEREVVIILLLLVIYTSLLSIIILLSYAFHPIFDFSKTKKWLYVTMLNLWNYKNDHIDRIKYLLYNWSNGGNICQK